MVDIKIKNSGKFQDIALLVDQDSFLERIDELRKILILRFDTNNPKENRWFMPFSTNWYKQKLSLMEKYYLDEDQLRKFKEWLNDDSNFIPHLQQKNLYSFTQALRDASIKLLYEHKKTHNFLPAIQAAIVMNVVREEDYESCVFTEYAPNIADTSKLFGIDRQNYKIPHEGKWLAVFFQPHTTIEEINEVIDKEFKKYRHTEHRTTENIKMYRDWYWLKKDKKLGYNKIAQNSEINTTWGSVRYGIKTYEGLLLGVQK